MFGFRRDSLQSGSVVPTSSGGSSNSATMEDIRNVIVGNVVPYSSIRDDLGAPKAGLIDDVENVRHDPANIVFDDRHDASEASKNALSADDDLDDEDDFEDDEDDEGDEGDFEDGEDGTLNGLDPKAGGSKPAVGGSLGGEDDDLDDLDDLDDEDDFEDDEDDEGDEGDFEDGEDGTLNGLDPKAGGSFGSEPSANIALQPSSLGAQFVNGGNSTADGSYKSYNLRRSSSTPVDPVASVNSDLASSRAGGSGRVVPFGNTVSSDATRDSSQPFPTRNVGSLPADSRFSSSLPAGSFRPSSRENLGSARGGIPSVGNTGYLDSYPAGEYSTLDGVGSSGENRRSQVSALGLDVNGSGAYSARFASQDGNLYSGGRAPADDTPLPYSGYTPMELRRPVSSVDSGYSLDRAGTSDFQLSRGAQEKLSELTFGILRSEIKNWVHSNLPAIVERIAEREIASIMQETDHVDENQ